MNSNDERRLDSNDNDVGDNNNAIRIQYQRKTNCMYL